MFDGSRIPYGFDEPPKTREWYEEKAKERTTAALADINRRKEYIKEIVREVLKEEGIIK